MDVDYFMNDNEAVCSINCCPVNPRVRIIYPSRTFGRLASRISRENKIKKQIKQSIWSLGHVTDMHVRKRPNEEPTTLTCSAQLLLT